MEVLSLLLFLACIPYASTYFLLKKIFKIDYNGNYFVHSVVSLAMIVLLSILFFIIMYNVSCGPEKSLYYNHLIGKTVYGKDSCYEYASDKFSLFNYLLYPTIVIILISEIIIKLLILKNKFIYFIFNLFFLSGIAYVLIYLFDHLDFSGLG
jgi:hypothetical protein